MNGEPKSENLLPTGGQLRRAIEIYLQYAYDKPPRAMLAKFIPPEGFEPIQWLMGPNIERDPPDAPAESVRSFVLRMGNGMYRHMKLRLSRPPRSNVFLLSVDSHDAILSALKGSADYEAIESLKRHNAIVAEAIRLAWENENLPTERDYLRSCLREARAAARNQSSSG
ncbi:MAG: hypothetical protein WC869_03975 [Phycisphaerae bacterium]|jgi:DNA-binding GntR family transcriptional regulator